MRRYESREARFSSRVLLSYVASKLPETLCVKAAVNDAPAEILLYDEIGFWGVTAKDFVLALAAAGPGPLTLRINSPGGDVFDGLAIYNALKARTAPVAVVVDGLAASAASFIAMAGSTLAMNEQSMLMIHNAWGVVVGDRNDMLETAAVMEKIDGQLAAIYASKSGKAASDIGAMMDSETWFTSSEAKDAGLCDAIVTAATQAPIVAAARIKAAAENASAAARAAYDPDGDGDDDAAEAIGLIQTAIGSLTDAIEALNGTAMDDTSDAAAAAEIAAKAHNAIEAMRRRLRLAEAEAA